MPRFDPGIHVFAARQVVDGRVKPGHDDGREHTPMTRRYLLITPSDGRTTPK
jgi:hypothetical protein